MAKSQTPNARQVPSNAEAQAAGTALIDAGGGEDKRPTAEAIAKRAPKTYRALARGYADGKVIEAGEVFATRIDKGSWMEEMKGKKQSALDRAVSDMQAPIPDDPDLTTFSHEALEAEALRLGLTNATGLGDDDLIAAIRAAYDRDRAQ